MNWKNNEVVKKNYDESGNYTVGGSSIIIKKKKKGRKGKKKRGQTRNEGKGFKSSKNQSFGEAGFHQKQQNPNPFQQNSGWQKNPLRAVKP